MGIVLSYIDLILRVAHLQQFVRLHRDLLQRLVTPLPSTSDGLARPIRKNGRYNNPWSSWKNPTVGAILKCMWTSRNESNVPSKPVCEHFVTSSMLQIFVDVIHQTILPLLYVLDYIFSALTPNHLLLCFTTLLCFRSWI